MYDTWSRERWWWCFAMGSHWCDAASHLGKFGHFPIQTPQCPSAQPPQGASLLDGSSKFMGCLVMAIWLYFCTNFCTILLDCAIDAPCRTGRESGLSRSLTSWKSLDPRKRKRKWDALRYARATEVFSYKQSISAEGEEKKIFLFEIEALMNKGIASETPEPLKWIQAPAPRRILPRVARLLACFPVSLLFAPTQTKRRCAYKGLGLLWIEIGLRIRHSSMRMFWERWNGCWGTLEITPPEGLIILPKGCTVLPEGLVTACNFGSASCQASDTLTT